MDSVKTEVLQSYFAQQLRRKITDVPYTYFTLLVATGTSPTLVLNANAKANEKRKLGAFQDMNNRTCKDCTRRVLLLKDLCAN